MIQNCQFKWHNIEKRGHIATWKTFSKNITSFEDQNNKLHMKKQGFFVSVDKMVALWKMSLYLILKMII